MPQIKIVQTLQIRINCNASIKSTRLVCLIASTRQNSLTTVCPFGAMKEPRWRLRGLQGVTLSLWAGNSSMEALLVGAFWKE